MKITSRKEITPNFLFDLFLSRDENNQSVNNAWPCTSLALASCFSYSIKQAWKNSDVQRKKGSIFKLKSPEMWRTRRTQFYEALNRERLKLWLLLKFKTRNLELPGFKEQDALNACADKWLPSHVNGINRECFHFHGLRVNQQGISYPQERINAVSIGR